MKIVQKLVDFKEYEIGEVFEHESYSFKCVVDDGGCENCVFEEQKCYKYLCKKRERSDNQNVIFQRVSDEFELDEIFEFRGIKLQCVKKTKCSECYCYDKNKDDDDEQFSCFGFNCFGCERVDEQDVMFKLIKS